MEKYKIVNKKFLKQLTEAALVIVVLLGCTPAITPEPTATQIPVPTNTSIPLPTPTVVVTVEFVQSITAGADPFHLPTALAFDEQGNFYVVDSYNQRIVKFDALAFTTPFEQKLATAVEFLNIKPFIIADVQIPLWIDE